MSDFSKIVSKILEEAREIEKNTKLLEIKQKRGSGIVCPSCGSIENEIINSRNNENFKVRRRKCVKCGHCWNTEEVISNRACTKKNEGDGKSWIK